MIKLYSSHCTKCKVLAMLMDKKGIEYTTIDNENVYLPLAELNGIMSMPFAELDGKIMNATDLQAWINKQ